VKLRYLWQCPLLCVLMTVISHSIGIKNLHIDELVRASDVIAVTEVTDVTALGPAEPILFRGQLLPAEAHSSDLLVRRVIKGTPLARLTVKYSLPKSFIGYRGLQRGTRTVFLRREQDHYSLADPYYPDFPAVLSPAKDLQTTAGDYAAIVVQEMLAVIASPIVSSDEKTQILQVDYALPANVEVVNAFREGMINAREPDLRRRLQSEIIQFGDVTELPEVVRLLLANSVSADQKMAFLYVIGNHVNDRRAIPTLDPLLRSGDSSLRVAAAEALWHIADRSEVSALLKSLQDSDEQVRYYVVRALSDIVNEPGWGGPGESEFRQDQQKYLTHWQDWARNRVP
jgi:hypothetical protein